MTEKADIVIIGAGIIGLCAALQLAQRTRARIVVVDKGRGPGEGSTGASTAACRYKYTHPKTVQLAKDGIHAYRNWPEFLGIDDPLARFHRLGVLWLADGRADWPEPEAERLGSLGIRTAVLDDKSVQERFPALNTCVLPPDLLTGKAHHCRGGGRHLLELDGGYIDPMDALQDLLTATRQCGAHVRFRAEAVDAIVESGRVRGVVLQSGERIECEVLINAAGPWCHAVFDMVGLKQSWPLEPTRIQILHTDRPSQMQGDIPVCVDLAAGIYFRPQSNGQQIVLGPVSEDDEKEVVGDPDDYAKYADDHFIRTKLHALHHRIPALSYRRRAQGYSGLYTINRADVHPVVGRTPVTGFYVANGFSGHGFKLAPAIGSLLAREISGKGGAFDTAVDREFLAMDREPIELHSKNVLA